MFPAEACFSGWQGTDGFQYGAILRDISVRKREAARIRYLAEYDSLTGLANRATLHAGLSAMISSAEPSASEVALLVIGLDGFQQINQLLGAIARKGQTLVPLDIHFNDKGRAKVLLGLAEGKNAADKRHAVAERDWQRDKARLMRERG